MAIHSVQVEFTNTEEIWNTVVQESDENMEVESEGVSSFVVNYATESDCFMAMHRFEGQIEYKIISSPPPIMHPPPYTR